MGNTKTTPEKYELSDFRRRKLMHEFHMFYDVNNDGQLQWKDFELARERICEKSGWKPGTPKWQQAVELFQDIWRHLQDSADDDVDGSITQEEWTAKSLDADRMLWDIQNDHAVNIDTHWGPRERGFDRGGNNFNRVLPLRTWFVLQLWTSIGEKNFEEQQRRQGSEESEVIENIPAWLEMYIRYKFDLYDRAGDGHVDGDEFEYVLSWFDVPAQDCRAAFRILSQSGSRRVGFDYFRLMTVEFFLSDDPAASGNYINGKLDYKMDLQTDT